MANKTIRFSTGIVADRSFALGATARDKTVFIDLDEKPVKAKVVREGFQVPSVVADAAKVDAFISGLDILRPETQPRVIAQSIAAGTKVGPGTVIDLVLAPRQDVPLGIFDDIHVDARKINTQDLLARVEQDRVLQELVLKYDSADEVPAEERKVLVTHIQESANLTIDDTKPERDFTKGFNAVRTALAFK